MEDVMEMVAAVFMSAPAGSIVVVTPEKEESKEEEDAEGEGDIEDMIAMMFPS